MPVFVEDEGITLTLRGGSTVTLIEKPLSVADKKAAMKWSLLISHSVKAKQRKAEEIQKVDEDSLTDEEAARLADEASEILASLDPSQVYAYVLSHRFQSWDFYATRADMEANQPVPMTQEAILEQCQYPARARLIAEIVEKLKAHDEAEARKNVELPANSGGQSRTQAQTVQ